MQISHPSRAKGEKKNRSGNDRMTDPNEVFDTETKCLSALSVCLFINLSICSLIYLYIDRFWSVCLSACLSLCVPFMCVVVCHLVTVRLNEEVEASKCGNGDIREFSNVKCRKQNILARVRNRGESTN